MSTPLLTLIVDPSSACAVCTSKCSPDTQWKNDRSFLCQTNVASLETLLKCTTWITIAEESLLCVNLLLGGDSLEDSVHVFLRLCSFLFV